MMDQSPYQTPVMDARHTWGPALPKCVSLFCCALITCAGCGGSNSSDSAVVPPPAPTVVDLGPSDSGSSESGLSKTGSSDADAPGGIELPPGEIPLPTSDESPKTDGGIQMPKDSTPPVESGARQSDANGSGSGANGSGANGSDAKGLSATTLPEVQYGTWDEIEAAAKSSGRITVVDLWSLACEPCLKEFPGLVQLHLSLGTSVQCIAVDLDYDGRKTRPPEHYEEPVAAFLQSVGATGFPTYISRTPNEDVYAATKLASIPAVLVYDAQGEIAKVFVDAGETAGFSYERDVIPLVTKMAG